MKTGFILKARVLRGNEGQERSGRQANDLGRDLGTLSKMNVKRCRSPSKQQVSRGNSEPPRLAQLVRSVIYLPSENPPLSSGFQLATLTPRSGLIVRIQVSPPVGSGAHGRPSELMLTFQLVFCVVKSQQVPQFPGQGNACAISVLFRTGRCLMQERDEVGCVCSSSPQTCM